jgi:hypothetical protein
MGGGILDTLVGWQEQQRAVSAVAAEIRGRLLTPQLGAPLVALLVVCTFLLSTL